MSKETKQLEVDDIIIGNKYNFYSKFIINRVTKTLAISKTTRFKRDYVGDWISESASNPWNRWSYNLSTPELEKKYKEYKIRYVVENTDFKELSFEKILEIYEVL